MTPVTHLFTAGGVRRPDPVCAAASEAYFDAYIERKSEGEANEAAAVAYVEALDKVENSVVF